VPAIGQIVFYSTAVHRILLLGVFAAHLTSALAVAGLGPPRFASVAPADNVTIHEVDASNQVDRPITFGRIFKQGEIPQCPQPVVGDAPIVNYQADVKNRWPDGSVKFAIVSFTHSLEAKSSIVVGFQSVASCNNGGYLTDSEMTGFNGGNWGAHIVVAPAGGPAVTTDAKTILTASEPAVNTFGDCRTDYWLQGRVVTAVIVQDCTSTSAYDFGWKWDGTTMFAPARGNAPTASFHPMFILYFYPNIHAVQVEYILEIPWSGRIQDQLADITLEAGSPATTVWSHTGARVLRDMSARNGSKTITSNSADFKSGDIGLPIVVCPPEGCKWGSGGTSIPWTTIASVQSATQATLMSAYYGPSATKLTSYINLQVAGTRHRKTFWSGIAPGDIRIDHNWAYLKSTMAFLNYDPNVTVSPDTSNGDGITAWNEWSVTDKGEIGGMGGLMAMSADYADNSEGAPLQREELLYLYNMGTCGIANSACAKAWDMLTGEIGRIDNHLKLGSVAGGAGAWNILGNVPFHLRESRTAADGNQSKTNYFYCSGFADINAGGNTTRCGAGSGSARGKALSRHAHSNDQWAPGNWPVAPVGTHSLLAGGWSVGGCNHWLDYAYTPYLLTGDYYYLENEYQSASMCLEHSNPDPAASWGSNRIFGYMNPAGAVLRELGWGLQTVARAAFIAPDGTPEANYYLAMMNSNLEVQEGVMGIRGTGLTPSDTNCSAASCYYTVASANRWNWGRATVLSQCGTNGPCRTIPVALHAVAGGSCPTSAQAQFLDPSITSAYYQPWMYNMLSIALSETREMGYAQAAPVSKEMQQRLAEQVLDASYNPYLIAAYEEGVKDVSGGFACNNNSSMNTEPFITSYSRLKKSFPYSIQDRSKFDAGGAAAWQNVPCGDHGYSLLARAAGSFLQFFGTSSSDPNCPGGICTAAETWSWLDGHVPYFSNRIAGSASCPATAFPKDEQIKFALAPR